jgi:DNA repair protein RadA/Sms
MMAAIMSSYQGLSIQKGIVFSGEVGLSGEVRAVQRLEQRINEAKKLGFTDMVISKYNKFNTQSVTGIKLHTFGQVDEVFSWLFG